MLETVFVAPCDAPVEVAWDYFSDHRNAVKYMHGMVSYTPTGPLDKCAGATFDGAMKLGPSTMKSTVETVTWEENSLAVYKSTQGVNLTTTYRFRKVDDDRCEVEVEMFFELPGGVAGRAMEKAIEPIVRSNANQTRDNMTRLVGEYHTEIKNSVQP
ncbi:SRPBCC family protein [Rhodococcus sp. NPDC003318]|uniref:SRPBCC family protein n=1 Tax=Rhodococcus sp. NPDC003318 TaxID=3364503 RepID=UPI00367FA86F